MQKNNYIFLKKIFDIFILPLSLILIFEEWGWDKLGEFSTYLSSFRSVKYIEAKIAKLSPLFSLILFLVIPCLLIPLKIFAIFLFSKKHVVSGIIIIILTKVFGTILFARFFKLTQNTLMTIPLFAYWYPRWKKMKDYIVHIVLDSKFWRLAKKLKRYLVKT